ncbi:MAG: DUF192 domain-containing protein [Pseudomonadota bacterium]
MSPDLDRRHRLRQGAALAASLGVGLGLGPLVGSLGAPGGVRAQDGSAATAAEPPRLVLPWTAVTVTTGDGAAHLFAAELADTEPARSRGLMFRRSLPADQGMLFVYQRVQPAAFWMRNTFISLDMLFIRADGVIHRVHAEAIPHDETSIPSGAPIRAVLEIRGGEAARRGIAAGDHVSADAMRAMLPPRQERLGPPD